jgi:hypothetical protein
LRFEPFRKHIRIWIASLNPRSIEFAPRQVDGWLETRVAMVVSTRLVTELSG